MILIIEREKKKSFFSSSTKILFFMLHIPHVCLTMKSKMPAGVHVSFIYVTLWQIINAINIGDSSSFYTHSLSMVRIFVCDGTYTNKVSDSCLICCVAHTQNHIIFYAGRFFGGRFICSYIINTCDVK